MASTDGGLASRHSLLFKLESLHVALTRVVLLCAARRRRKTSLKFFSVKTYLNACAKLSYSKYFKRKKLITFPNFIFFYLLLFQSRYAMIDIFKKYNYLSSKPWLCRRLEISCQKTFYQPVKYKDQLVLHSTKSSSEIMSLQNLIFQGMYCKEAAFIIRK